MSRAASVIVLATLAVPLLAQAQAQPPIGSYTIRADQVQTTLTDLRPDDGMDPSVAFQSKGYLYIDPFEAQPSLTATYENSLLPVDQGLAMVRPTSLGGSRVSAQVMPDRFSARVDLSLPLQPVIAYLPGEEEAPGPFHAMVSAGYLGGVMDAFYTLAPHTSMTISGRLTMSKTLDTAALDAMVAKGRYADYTVTDGTSSQFMQLSFSGPQGASDWETSTFSQQFSLPEPFTRTRQDSGPLTQTLSTPFAVTVTNNGDESFTGQFRWTLGMMPAIQVDMTPVPEPTTWSLMAIGGLGLASAWRRRQAVVC